MEEKPLVVADGQGPPEADLDASGVDRAQIRAMLRLNPEERLRRVQDYVESAAEIRELNARRPLR